MNVFEPLFLVLVLVTVITIVTAAILAVSGQVARAGRILRRLSIGAGVYFAVVIVVSMVTPRRDYRVGDTRCFDDWCITVTNARRTGLTLRHPMRSGFSCRTGPGGRRWERREPPSI